METRTQILRSCGGLILTRTPCLVLVNMMALHDVKKSEMRSGFVVANSHVLDIWGGEKHIHEFGAFSQ